MNTPDPDRMTRTTVYLTNELLEQVREVAARRGETSARFIRSAIVSALGRQRPAPQGGFLVRVDT